MNTKLFNFDSCGDILKFLVSIRPNIGFLHRNVTLVVAAMCKMLVKETIYLIEKKKKKKLKNKRAIFKNY